MKSKKSGKSPSIDKQIIFLEEIILYCIFLTIIHVFISFIQQIAAIVPKLLIPVQEFFGRKKIGIIVFLTFEP